LPESKAITPLLAVLGDLTAWLESQEVRGLVIGGLAASLWGRPRLTRDVDVLVWVEESRWPGLLAAGADHGFQPRRPDVLANNRRFRV
jgi:hypothetical protein